MRGEGGSGQGRRAGAPPGAGWAGRCAGPGAAPELFSFCSGGHLCAGREVRFFGAGGVVPWRRRDVRIHCVARRVLSVAVAPRA